MKLKMDGICKSFGSNEVLKSVGFQLGEGEICALLGENGAGKSTLMNILGGVLQPDSGDILLDGEKKTFDSPAQSLDAGIAFIHQELNLINDLPIYENMFIGRELKKKSGFLDHKRMIEQTSRVFDRMGLTLDPREMVRNLDASYKQIVEISRALLMDAKIIIMDEPTTSLTDPEIEKVFAILRQLRQQKVGIVFISHKLREVMEICDTYTVLRDGVMVASGSVKDVTTSDLARFMVGHDVRTEKLGSGAQRGEERLSLRGLTQEPHFRNIDLTAYAGEVLGVSKRAVFCGIRRGADERRRDQALRPSGADHLDPTGQAAGHCLCAAQPQGERHHQGYVDPRKRNDRFLAGSDAPRPVESRETAGGV